MERLTERTKAGTPNLKVECEKAKDQIYLSARRQLAIDRLADYEDIGTLEELTALTKARDEGRVVVLPCKVGATVWLTKSYFSCARFPIEGNYASIRGINRNGEILYQCITASNKIERQFSSEDIGKTVFLTLAEAYAALGGGSENAT